MLIVCAYDHDVKSDARQALASMTPSIKELREVPADTVEQMFAQLDPQLKQRRDQLPDNGILILCGLDGVLIEPEAEAHVLAHLEAIYRVFNAHIARTDFWRAVEPGRTDRAIGAELMSFGQRNAAGATGDDVERWRAELAEQFRYFMRDIGFEPEVLPHVQRGLLMAAHRGDVLLGLATGNIEGVARQKLQALQLDRFFQDAPAGYGDFALHRHELVADALHRAGWIDPQTGQAARPMDRVFLIGDTSGDIEAARKIGLRAVGISSGGYGLRELRSAGAEAAFMRFDRAVEWILDQAFSPLLMTAPRPS